MLVSQALDLPEDLSGICHAISQFIAAEVKPRHAKLAHLIDDTSMRYAPDGRYVPEIRQAIGEIQQASAKAGFYNMCVPKELGGEGLGYLAWYAAWERISQECGGQYWMGNHMLAHWATGPSPVLTQLSAANRRDLLPELTSGAKTLCFGMTEPDAGSDAMMMRTKAVATEGGWRINGSKIWTTNSPYADYCILFAVTDEAMAKQRKGGISCFLVPTNSPGFEVQRIIKLWGQSGGNEAVLLFSDVFVPSENLVGELHRGFGVAMLGVNLGRIYNSARSIAWGTLALTQAFDYAKQRKAFGHAIADYQSVTFPLTEALMDLQCARLYALNTCLMLDEGKQVNEQMAVMKHQAVKAAQLALDRSIQAHGAIGMTNELHLAELFLTLRTLSIADGTNEILKRTVTNAILADRFSV